MKKLIMIGAVFILILSTTSFAFQNEPDGFRGLKWGDPPTEDMVFVKTIDDIKGYFRKDEKMNIGDATLRMIVYQFYDDPERFNGVLMLFNKEENYDILEDILQVRFGEETESDMLYKLSWEGQETYVELDYDMFEESGTLIFASVPITLEMMEAKKQKQAEKAEGDF